jgi:predicted nucleic acid-binding protein
LFKRILASGEVDKIKLRTDAQIIATAIVNQAEKIISHDPDFTKIAQGRISVEEVPNIQTQMDIEFSD